MIIAPLPPLAFGFANLAMLGWLAAAAAPILIHLWSRRRHREVPWAAVTFLVAAMRKTSRRIQLQHWLLLAVRTLVIVLVVLAVAEPYGVGTLAGGLGGGPTHRILVIDSSYSMGYRIGEMTRFARAKNLAAELVRDSGPADVFTVIRLGEPSTVVVGRDVVDHAAVTSQIESLTLPHAGGDLPSALTLIDEALSDDRGKGTIANSDLRREVLFFTDLQLKTWDMQGPNAPLSQRLSALTQRGNVVIVDLAASDSSNLVVTHLTAIDPYVTTIRETTFETLLHAFGEHSYDAQRVELIVDGEPVAEQTVAIASGNDGIVRFSHRFHDNGDHVVAVRSPGDNLDIDNFRWLVVPVRDEVRVLCVEGQAGAARYVASALDPDPMDASPIHPIVVAEGELAGLELDDFDAIFLCNISQFTPNETQRLIRFARRGGGVIVFLGERARPAMINELASELLPARIGELQVNHQPGINPLGYRHPIVAPFRGRETAGLVSTPVARYYRLMPDQSAATTDEKQNEEPAGVGDVALTRSASQGEREVNFAELAAQFANGDPWIVTRTLGEGVVLLIATDGALVSTDSETGEPWTYWPTWPSFLPMVREMLAFSLRGQQGNWQQPVGSVLSARRRSAQNGATEVEVSRPDGTTALAEIEPMADGGWRYDATNLSGVYLVRAGGGVTVPYAVNVDSSESDLSRISADTLPAEILVRSTPNDDRDAPAADLMTNTGWQQPLLAATFGLLLLESLLAWRFGRGVV